jgi:hypothetical protein
MLSSRHTRPTYWNEYDTGRLASPDPTRRPSPCPPLDDIVSHASTNSSMHVRRLNLAAVHRPFCPNHTPVPMSEKVFQCSIGISRSVLPTLADDTIQRRSLCRRARIIPDIPRSSCLNRNPIDAPHVTINRRKRCFGGAAHYLRRRTRQKVKLYFIYLFVLKQI